MEAHQCKLEPEELCNLLRTAVGVCREKGFLMADLPVPGISKWRKEVHCYSPWSPDVTEQTDPYSIFS